MYSALAKYHQTRVATDLRYKQPLSVDLFAGFGGVSTGFKTAVGRDIDVAINHDPHALDVHETNHPVTHHYTESVWKCVPEVVTRGYPVGYLHLSPDCTHHSIARGGRPTQKNVRALARIGTRWAIRVKPTVITLENVKEFQDWGPIDSKGKVIRSKKGVYFKTYVRQFRKMGYEVEWRLLDCSEYGAPTNRKRLFMIMRCDGKPIIWPKPTHGPQATKPLIPAHTHINFNYPTESIFDRKKPLADNTLRRIANGLQKFVIDSDKPFVLNQNQAAYIMKYQKQSPGSSLYSPLHTITNVNKHYLVSALLKKYVGSRNTVPFQGNSNVIAVPYLIPTDHTSSVSHGQDIQKPLSTIVTKQRHGLVYAYLVKYYNTGKGQSLHEPLHTITTKDTFALVQLHGSMYKIEDIFYRMLQPSELKLLQGLPDNYSIDFLSDGTPITKTKKVAMIGNSVPPQVITAIVRANLPAALFPNGIKPKI